MASVHVLSVPLTKFDAYATNNIRDKVGTTSGTQVQRDGLAESSQSRALRITFTLQTCKPRFRIFA